MHRRFVIAAVSAGLIAAATTLAVTRPAPASAAGDPTGRRITTTATGTASGTPDTATIGLAVDSSAGSAADVLAANAQKTQRVLDGVKFVGVKSEDVRTDGVSLFPTFDKAGHVNGYTVSTHLTVKTHDVPNAGRVIDAAVKLAGNDIRVDTVALSIEDTGPVMRAARTDAVHAARTQAGELARAAGARLGPVRTIAEVSPTTPTSFALQRNMAADAAVPIAPGTEELTVQVKVVYELR
ncbi:MAG: SIMPL domain-containing protein [Acidimicrobiia bacterium]